MTPAEYDRAERMAVRAAPNRILEAFQPSHFLRSGYPSRVETPEELARYISVMHEQQPRDLLPRVLGHLTDEEFRYAKEAARIAQDLASSLGSKMPSLRASLLSSIWAFRHIRDLCPGKGVVLEIGPGSGYLGIMLMLHGYGYISTEVTQAFYLLQNKFFSHVAGENFVELAVTKETLCEYQRISPGTCLHVPWWKFATNEPTRINLSVDCIVGSGVFCEMHPHAFGYFSRQAKRWLAPKGVLYMHGPGAEGTGHLSSVLATLEKAGLKKAHSDKLGASETDFSIDVGYFFAHTERGVRERILEGRRAMARGPNVEALDDYLLSLSPDTSTDDERFLGFLAGT